MVKFFFCVWLRTTPCRCVRSHDGRGASVLPVTLSVSSTSSLCARTAGKNVLCCAQTSLALFDKKRDLKRVDRQDDRVGEGGAGERTARGCPRDVPRCRCSSPRPPHHFSCRGVVSVHLRGTQFSACVCSSCLVSRQMVCIFFFLDAVACTAEPFASSTRRRKDQKARRFAVGSHWRTAPFRVGLLALSPHASPAVLLSAKK